MARRRRGLSSCAVPGCPELVSRGRCETHRLELRAEQDARRESARDRGYDREWEQTRKDFLEEHPWCSWPTCTRPAVDVHHLDGLGPLGPRGHDWGNLQGLCHGHHSQVTNRERASRA